MAELLVTSAKVVGTKFDFRNNEKKAIRKTAHMETCNGRRKSKHLKIANRMSTVIGNLRAGDLASTRLEACLRILTSGDPKNLTSAPKYRLTCLRQVK